jgi:outer membrane lipase/esterase
MTFSSLATRLALRCGTVLLSAGLLASCGGGTSTQDRFLPTRLVVFGDESSLLRSDGSKYSVNQLDTADSNSNGSTTDLLCDSKRLWVQELSTYYGLQFEACKVRTDAVTALNSAAYAAGITEVETQVSDFSANFLHDALGSKDLVTVLVGVNDIKAVYQDGNLATEGDKSAEVAARGKRVASVVNAVAATGARVLVSTIPDIGLSPWALAQGASEASLVSRLVSTFNTNLRLGLVNDGSKIGLLLLDDLTRAAVQNAGTYGYSDVSSPACTLGNRDGLLYTCTTGTLVATGADTAYLWADDLHLGPKMQSSYLGSQAVTRASNNPF